jgi:serine/threonine protein kinase/formylglycine-generating enzyme required for sulfatase activity
MDPSRWKTLRAALEELVEVPASARTAALDRIAGDDDDLRAELERMLPTWDHALDLESPHARDPAPASDLGRRIGPWILQRELGVGGMGHVFLARRAEGGFDQRVALKLIRRGLDTDKVLRRFERERALLARLAHLSIAQLHDGGATSEGLPWFAMEYVEGQPIDAWCAARRLGARERVELFLKVAAAVQHAHSHLIVHRDIKPSNILVSADGVPKLLDFGIAKALEEDADDEPTLTTTGERVLTPLYASPEQWHGEPATIASDVYALGVVLYELLTGGPPRSREELTKLEREADWPDAERPSTRGARQTDTTRLGVDTRVLARATAGDLDLIVLEALRNDPARRYPTVERFAADLQRWLEGRPVDARGDSVAYRTVRFVRRNRIAVGAAAVVVLGLAIGLLVAIAGWKDAVAANEHAQRETRKLLQLAARQDLQDLQSEADELWPLDPALLPRLEAWIAKADRLLRDVPQHRATLVELDAQSDGALQLDEEEKRWWRRQIESHLADLATFTDPEKGLFTDAANATGVGIPHRARLIRSAAAGCAEGSAGQQAWKEARAYVRSTPRYGSMELPVVFGLVPIGPDPTSGMLEFYDVLTGTEPARGPDGAAEVHEETGLVFVLVPPASTQVGAQVTDPSAPYYDVEANVKSETPPLPVELAPFLISKFEITQVQWARMDGTNPSARNAKDQLASPSDQDLRPVQMVSWDDCRRVLDRYGMVLPTAAQWEHAARGGTVTPWWTGPTTADLWKSENLLDAAGVEAVGHGSPAESWNDLGGLTVPVGRYLPNPFGLHDVLGNVSEWCLDITAPWGGEPRPGRGIRVMTGGSSREMRGGNYRLMAAKSRASYRISAPPGRRADMVGARPVILLVEDGPRWGP